MPVGLFFDMRAKPGHMEHYFAHVARLRPHLDRHAALLMLERFRPLDGPEALLSHQLWADEAALAGWRADAAHRHAQGEGRGVHFADYRIRVAVEVSPADGPARLIVAAYGTAPAGAGRAYESLTRPGRFLTVAEAADGAVARALAAAAVAEDVRVFRTLRDYGMHDRAEAPGG